MVDGNQLLSPLAHLSLRSEEFFGGDFVGDVAVRRDVAELVYSFRETTFGPTDQSAALSRIGFTGMCNDFREMRSA
jgi:hypothetical protein